jgi:hypothetical protein
MPFWRREEPAHERLAREGGLVPERGARDGRQRWFEDLVGIHGVPRPREWDVVASTVAPGLAGDRVVFVVLPDETLLIEEGEGGDVEPLAKVVESQLALPYRVLAVRQGDDRWAVAANGIEALELPELRGNEVTFTVQGMNRQLLIDGVEVDESFPALEQLVDERDDGFVLEAQRLDGDLWEVRITPL